MMDNSDCLVERHEGSESFFNFGLWDYFKYKMYYWGELRFEASNVHERTHESPSTLFCLNRVYPHAIEIGQPVPVYSKWRMAIAIFVWIFMAAMWLIEYPNNFSLDDMLHWSFFITLSPLYLGTLAVWYVYRLNNMPGRQTLMFNRKTRQVIAYQVRKPGFFRFWDTGKPQIKVLPWKNFRVRVYFCDEGQGNKYSILGLFWSQKEHPEKLKDMVRLYKGDHSRNNGYQFRLWEHIRQYMEEHGPPIQPGEELGPDATEPSPFPDKIIRKAGGESYNWEKIKAMSADKSE
jgi:hypothetical protein